MTKTKNGANDVSNGKTAQENNETDGTREEKLRKVAKSFVENHKFSRGSDDKKFYLVNKSGYGSVFDYGGEDESTVADIIADYAYKWNSLSLADDEIKKVVKYAKPTLRRSKTIKSKGVTEFMFLTDDAFFYRYSWGKLGAENFAILKVTVKGIEEVESAPVIFVGDPPHFIERIPTDGKMNVAALDKLKQYGNFSEEDWLLRVAELVAYLMPEKPTPLYHSQAISGSGKTWNAALFRAIVYGLHGNDLEAEMITSTEIGDSIKPVLASNYSVILDNLSMKGLSVKERIKLSDALALASIGAGLQDRQFANNAKGKNRNKAVDKTRMTTHAHVTYIETMAFQADIPRRSIKFNLKPLKNDVSFDGEQIVNQFKSEQPEIICTVLLAFGKALAGEPLPFPMKSFGLWERLSYHFVNALYGDGTGEQFRKDLQDNQARYFDDMTEDSTFAVIVSDMFEMAPHLHEMMEELKGRLQQAQEIDDDQNDLTPDARIFIQEKINRINGFLKGLEITDDDEQTVIRSKRSMQPLGELFKFVADETGRDEADRDFARMGRYSFKGMFEANGSLFQAQGVELAEHLKGGKGSKLPPGQRHIDLIKKYPI